MKISSTIIRIERRWGPLGEIEKKWPQRKEMLQDFQRCNIILIHSSCFCVIWNYFEELWWRTSPYKAANGAKEVEKEERVAVIGHVHPKALANHNLEPFFIFFYDDTCHAPIWPYFSSIVILIVFAHWKQNILFRVELKGKPMLLGVSYIWSLI